MISGASEFYRSYFDLTIGSFKEGLAVSIAMAGTFIGNLFAGSISDKLGRKRALFTAAILFSFCTLGSALSPNYAMLVITRFVGGLGIGVSLLVAPMFIAEFAPSERRGLLVSFNQLNIGIGYMLAYVLNTIVLKIIPDPEITWRWMFGIGFFFPLIYIVLLFFIPESPRWLIIKGKDEEAKKIMDKVGGNEYVEKEFPQIKQTVAEDAQKEHPSFGVLLKELFNKRMRIVLLVALSVGFFQMASGINAVFFFGPKIFRIAGFGGAGAFFQANIIGIVMVIMTIVSMFLIDRLGRKPLLYIGVTIMLLGMVIAGTYFNSARYQVKPESITTIVESTPETDKQHVKIAITELSKESAMQEKDFFVTLKNKFIQQAGDDGIKLYSNYKDQVLDASISINSIMVLVAILLIVIGFSISLGPITWALLSEIFPSRLRGIGISIAGALNGLTSFVVGTLFPIEIEKLGSANTFFIYGIFMALCLFFVYRWYPETKGKTLEEIEKELIR